MPEPQAGAIDRERLVVPLASAVDARESGGKAASLAKLMALGMPVPEGFVITDAALRLVMARGGAPLAWLTHRARSLQAERIAAFFEGVPLPRELEDAIGDAWRRLEASPVIVRSSAAGEDSDAASFAGQLDSIAGVAGEDALRRAVSTVWASRWSHRVLAYQIARDTPLAGMGVIVQRQIAGSLSGVLFTVDPRSPNRMLLEYCGGAGESLVSGRVNPGRIVVSRRDLRWTVVAPPETPIAHEAALLNDVQMTALARMALAIERAFGAPQDIEWTMDDEGRLWIVQARPITVPAHDVTRGAPSAGPGAVLWSNANVNENFPFPISPLLYSIAAEGYYHYFRNLGRSFGVSERRLAMMEQPLRHIIGVHGARMYYNLTSIHAVLRSAPAGDLLAASFNQFTGAADMAAPDAHGSFAARARGRLSQCGELAIIAASTTRQYFSLTKRVERFERTVAAFAERTRPDRLTGRSLVELLGDFRAFRDIRCNRWNDAALADAGSMVCYGILQRLLARAFPDEDQQALHNTLLKALPDLVSGRPAIELWELSRLVRSNASLRRLFTECSSNEVIEALSRTPEFAGFNEAFRRYLEAWGFRCSAELMLTTPSFMEEPAPVIDILKSYAAMDGPSPVDRLRQQEAERLAETGRVLRALRSRAARPFVPFLSLSPVVAVVLTWTQRSIQLRERARLKQALLYNRLRHVARAIGARLTEQGRLERQDDVFFLTADEIDLLVSGHAMFPDHVRPLVALRRQAHAEVSATSPPDTLWLAPGEYRPTSVAPAPERADDAGSRSRLSGIGACGGIVAGRAAVLQDVAEADRLARGDVLITRQTDPGWGPIFPLISGLVIERGGMLSHGAIIAREFGIPAVVGVKDATRLIPDGKAIVVDGDKGLVRLVAEAM
jgi:pyruvate,water dikinase